MIIIFMNYWITLFYKKYFEYFNYFAYIFVYYYTFEISIVILLTILITITYVQSHNIAYYLLEKKFERFKTESNVFKTNKTKIFSKEDIPLLIFEKINKYLIIPIKDKNEVMIFHFNQIDKKLEKYFHKYRLKYYEQHKEKLEGFEEKHINGMCFSYLSKDKRKNNTFLIYLKTYWINVLIHEYMHFLYNTYLDDFMKDEWKKIFKNEKTFTTEYSKFSAEEFFTESLTTFILNNIHFPFIKKEHIENVSKFYNYSNLSLEVEMFIHEYIFSIESFIK